MREKKIQFRTADGYRITGLLAEISQPRGWVVMLHGITENKDEYGGYYKDLAEALNSRGLGTLRIDFRGHGESSGTSMDISVLGDVLDIEASLDQLSGEGDLPLAFIATSFGAGPAILAAHPRRAYVRCLTLIAPVLDYARTFLAPETPWAEQWFGAKAEKAIKQTGYFTLEKFKLSPKLLEEFRYIRPLDFLRESGIPSLIIHGDRDSMVPYGVSADAATKQASLALHTLKDADHGFSHFEDENGTSALSLGLKRELIGEAVRFVASKIS